QCYIFKNKTRIINPLGLYFFALIVNSVFINGAMKSGGVGAEELCCQDAAKMDLLSVKPLLYRKALKGL
ncbi:TPA: hypothetical protein ACIU9V_004754, partial [Salmonella enterica subsp. enterica serovar Typhimurium]